MYPKPKFNLTTFIYQIATCLAWSLINIPLIVFIMSFIINFLQTNFQFNNPHILIISIIIIYLSCTIVIGIKKHHALKLDYDTTLKRLIQTYQARLIKTDSSHQQIINVVSQICIGLNLTPPQIYLINDPKIANLMIFQNHNTNYLFITQDLLNLLNAYELEAILAIELNSLTTGYHHQIIEQYLLTQQFDNLTKHLYYKIILNLDALLIVIGWCLIDMVNNQSQTFCLYGITFGIGALIPLLDIWHTKQIQKHLNHINTLAIQLNDNPQTLIQAFTKIIQTNTNFPMTNHIEDVLWLNPALDNYNRPSLQTQLNQLKLF